MFSPPPGAQIPYLGPAFDPGVLARRASSKEKIFDQVTNELCEEIDKIAPNYVSITTVPNLIDVRSFMWKKYQEHLRFTYSIDLEKSLDEIWASFTRRCRQKIKRVSEHSPEIEQTNDVSPMLDIWRARFSELGVQVPLLSDEYLKDLVAAFPQDITIYNLMIDGRLAAAEACCAMQKEQDAVWIGGARSDWDFSVNEYLDWEVVQRAKSEGFKKLDLGVWDVGFSPYKAKFDPMVEPFCTLNKTDKLYKIYYVYKKIRDLRS
jgi:lipid II:glycine glycyltransferase (peptidoglycan interpeptide bridge formation enzyme)